MKRYTSVDDFILGHSQWNEMLLLLRKTILDSGLIETVKWGAPVYTYDGKNLIGIGAFKTYCGIWFYQGALLQDKKKKLINAQEGVTKALRQWRFNNIDEIDEKLLLDYIHEAIENQKQGRAIKAEKKKELIIPLALANEFKQDYELKDSFENFTLSKKREFTEYIDSAKRDSTKKQRIAKIKAMIKAGIGLNDKYRK